MPDHLIRKLEHFTRLSAADRLALHGLARSVRAVGRHQDLLRDGDSPRHVSLVLEGWACRYKQLEDGRRQIVAHVLPGDFCDGYLLVLRALDHAVGTLTPVRVAEIPSTALMEVLDQHPRIMQALWWETLVAAAIQREWTVSLGQRTALERVAHLFCELFWRLRMIGLTEGDTCPLPLTQVEIADTLGLTNVHVNRMLHQMRGAGLIVLKSKRLTILDLPALQDIALFNAGYLHLEREGSHLDAEG